MDLGYRLKKIREEKKLSQHEVAHLLKVSQKTLSNIESGKTVPNILQIAKLGAIYEINMLEFLENSGIFFAPPPSQTIGRPKGIEKPKS
ncbi:helix-turn-helix domain-containing protein [Algoriphagus formosus]|uniref:XRE family transcriptional regulator n=1 Tax=Algoriphagus formosus TaxID=2007308 RepID=A0A4R5VFP2_9BACT|nr:XRE family transcriptional regulator [Algoriphagus aquimaris]